MQPRKILHSMVVSKELSKNKLILLRIIAMGLSMQCRNLEKREIEVDNSWLMCHEEFLYGIGGSGTKLLEGPVEEVGMDIRLMLGVEHL